MTKVLGFFVCFAIKEPLDFGQEFRKKLLQFKSLWQSKNLRIFAK
jgi:hypothetical protein